MGFPLELTFRLDYLIDVHPEMLQGSLSVDFRELLRIGKCVQHLRQVIRCLNAIHGRRLEGASRRMVKAKSLKNRDNVIA